MTREFQIPRDEIMKAAVKMVELEGATWGPGVPFKFSERPRHVAVFYEEGVMDRDAMLAKLGELGADLGVLEAAPDAVLAELLRLLDGKGGAGPGEGEAGAGAGNGMEMFAEEAPDMQVGLVRRYEEKNWPQLERMNTKRGDLVRAYTHARKLTPGLSAKAFFDPNGTFTGGR